MNATYDRFASTHITVDAFIIEPTPILHKTRGHTWVRVHSTIATILPDGLRSVGDGTNDVYSEDGECLLSVPDVLCNFLNEEQALAILVAAPCR